MGKEKQHGEFLPEAQRSMLPTPETAAQLYDLLNDDPLHPPVREAFPVELHEVAIAIRRLGPREYQALMFYIRPPDPHRWTAEQAVQHILRNGGNVDRFTQCMVAISKLKNGHPDPGDVLRLTRTELPEQGMNMLDPLGLSDPPSSVSAAVPLTITLTGKLGTYPVTIEPARNYSHVHCGKHSHNLQNGATMTLGRGELHIHSAFGHSINPPRTAENHLPVGEIEHPSLSLGAVAVDLAQSMPEDKPAHDDGISRACIKIRRSTDGKRLTLLDCGALNTINIAQGDDRTTYEPETLRSVNDEGTVQKPPGPSHEE